MNTTKSESVQKLAAALAKAQGEVENPHKTAENSHFRNRYADLAEVINTVRPVFAKHGLSVVQMPGWDDGRVTVETTLLHESGEWITGTASTPIAKADPQGVGSACTYLRRYSLAAVCMVAQEDDDGNGASRPQSNGESQSRPQSNGNGGAKATPKQLEYLDSLMGSSVFTEEERAAVGRKIATGDRAAVSEAIERAKAAVDARKEGAPA